MDQFDDSILNNFQGQYKVITSGLTYDNWEQDNSESTTCDYQGLVWTCSTESVKDNFYYQWKEQTKSAYHIASDGQKAAADKFSSFMIGHQISTAGQDTGYCFTHSVYGAVCLLQNASAGIDTYRLSATEWTAALSGTEANVVTQIKGTSGALQDKTATDGNGDLSKIDWMDYYHCRAATTANVYDCAAFNPENSTDGVSQGYPRFGTNESAAGYIGYVKLAGATSGTASVRTDWSVQYAGASQLVMVAAVSALAFLAF